jgi:HK97 gp10 family phage protein
MPFQSNLNNVLHALDAAEQRALTAVGEFCRSESQVRSPVKTGALRDSNDYSVNHTEKSVRIGNNIEYGVFVHEGGYHRHQNPWLENAVMENVSRIKSLISEMMRL